MRSAPDLEIHLGYWLRLVSNHVSGNFARRLQRHHMSVAEWVVLSLINSNQDVTSARIVELTGMTRGAISKVVEKLEIKQWIRRISNTMDGRIQTLSLTQQGERILPTLVDITDKNDEDFFNVLNRKEQETLRKLLLKLAQAHHLTGTPID